MKRIQTKEQRDAILASIKESKLKIGYSLEIFEGLQIFTKFVEDNKRFYLEIYQDNSTNAIINYYYTKEDQMLKRISDTKESYVLRREYKEKRKKEQKGRITGAAACADAVRAELKKVFPFVKFSVKSSTFSMGDSVSVSWSDGPTTKEVDPIIGKYQYGHFDGMQDLYEYSNRVDGLPQAKYVSGNRSMSEETETILKPIAAHIFESLKTEGNDSRPFNCWDSPQFLYQVFNACSFATGAKVVNIVNTGLTCGINQAANFYKLEFDLSNVKEATEPQKAEVKQGSVNIIEYGKGLAVIGETYPIREKLKEIGGKWNKFLTCGAGWVFTSDKLEEIKNMLLSLKQSKEQEGQSITPDDQPTTLKDEVNNTLEFFTKTDLQIYGEVQESTQKALIVQRPEVKEFNSLSEIQKAAKEGQIISLLNLSNLLNKNNQKAIN